MKAEDIVTNERRDELRMYYYATQDWLPEGPENDECDPGDVQRAFDAGFYLALEETSDRPLQLRIDGDLIDG